MLPITVALLQLSSAGLDHAANLAKGDAFCRRAAALGADVVLFPEMWNIGYAPFAKHWGNRHPRRAAAATAVRSGSDLDPTEPANWQGLAVEPDGEFVDHFRRLARELDLAIAVTYLERWDPTPRNTVSLIDRRGELVFTYAKVHTCVFNDFEHALTPGDEFVVGELETRHGPVRIGAMICFDREFPESARILMLQGAELILTPNACILEPHRLGQVRARAFENMVGIAVANYAAPEQNGHSCAFHPVANDERGRPRDPLVVEAGEREGIFPATFDLEELRAWRAREIWGNAYRRPHRYAQLAALEAAPARGGVSLQAGGAPPAAQPVPLVPR